MTKDVDVQKQRHVCKTYLLRKIYILYVTVKRAYYGNASLAAEQGYTQ